ncbi:MAG: DUF1320 domain-containing protein [Gammaproteobacteria bacterium]
MYTTKQEMIDRFGEPELIQLTDRDGSAGAIVDDVLDQALTDADSEIDSYLAVRYSLPLPETPRVIKRIAADIARWHLYDDSAPEDIRNRYKDAVKLLEGIRDGKVALGLSDLPAGQGAGDVQTKTHDPIFTRDDLKDFS